MRTVQLVLFLAVLFCSCIVGIVYFEGEGVRRLEVQSLHYFARPHTSIATESIKGPSIWVGSELEKQPEKWKEHLSSEHIKDIENTITKASKECNLNLSSEIDEDELAARLSPLSKEQCPFGPLMTEAIARWKNKLSVTDIGFRVISGVPTQNWTATKSSLFFWCVGLHLGRTGAQNNDGHVLGHVRDIGGDHHKERQFKSKGNIAFHCDTADVVGLLALSKPMEGGTSRLISSGTVYNEFLAQRPDLVPELYKITALDTRGSGGVDYVWIRPLRYFDGVLRTFWHEEYFATALNLPNGPNQTEVQREAHEVYSSIIARDDLWLDMELEVGDIQLVSNHAVLHARAAFTDYPKEEDEKLGVDRRRHLLRLWLSIEPPSGLWERLLKEMSRLEVLYWLIEAKIRNL